MAYPSRPRPDGPACDFLAAHKAVELMVSLVPPIAVSRLWERLHLPHKAMDRGDHQFQHATSASILTLSQGRMCKPGDPHAGPNHFDWSTANVPVHLTPPAISP